MRLRRVQDLLQTLILHEVRHKQAQAFVVGGLGSDQLEHGLCRDKQARGGPGVTSQASPCGGHLLRPQLETQREAGLCA